MLVGHVVNDSSGRQNRQTMTARQANADIRKHVKRKNVMRSCEHTLVVSNTSKILCFLLQAVSKEALPYGDRCRTARTECLSLMMMLDTKEFW